jgi:ribonuclease HI
VGSGVAIFKGSNLVAKVRLKLNTRCSNNLAEQFAILKALEAIESLDNNTINPLTAIIYADSRVSLDSLLNPKNHAFLVEKIRGKVATLDKKEWKIKFSWVKAHAGNYGNETADRLAKEAARGHTTKYEYNRIPISAIKYEAAEESIKKWQTECTTHKAMATKQYYPTVRDRLRSKIKLTPKITAMLTGHGKT